MEPPTPVPPPAPSSGGSPWTLVAFWFLGAVVLAWAGWNVFLAAFLLPLFTWEDWDLGVALAAVWAVPGVVAVLLAPAHLYSMTFGRLDPWRRRLTRWMSWSLGTAFGAALVIIVVCFLVGPTF